MIELGSSSAETSQAEIGIGWRDQWIGASLALGYAVLLVATSSSLAMSRDESFYAIAAERYAGWFELLAAEPERALQQESIDHHWSYNREHPALAKSLFALSWIVQKHSQAFGSDTLAFRFPAIAMSGLLLWLTYLFGARLFGRLAGVFASISLGLLPRVFYHAHLSSFDVPITLMITWTVYAYWRSLPERDDDDERPRWGWILWTGVAFGCALATKHNAWVLPGIFAIHAGWRAVARRRGRAEVAAMASSPRRRFGAHFPWWAVSMGTIGPALLVGTLPFVWNRTLERLGWYASFHLQHVYYNMAYFGRNYFEPPFPISYPFVMMAFTIGVTTLLLGMVGLGARSAAWLPRRVARWLERRLALQPTVAPRDARLTDILLVGSLLAPLLMIALPSSPIFGGTKHFFPAYPFFALYAGVGFSIAVEGAVRWRAWHEEARRIVPASMLVIALIPGAVEAAHSHPYGLSHYGYLAGGPRGAATLGMNRQFWGFTTGSLVPYLKRKMPAGGTVYLCDTTTKALELLWRDGQLPPSIRPARSLPQADYVLVHHEHHFAEVDFQAWVAFGRVQPDYVLTYDGVPIISVYENPRRERAVTQDRPGDRRTTRRPITP